MSDSSLIAHVVSGDDGTRLRVRCKNHVTNAPIDLTGQTVVLRWKVGSGVTEERTTTNLTPETDPANLGRADYVFVPADITSGGVMAVEVRRTDSQGRSAISVNTVLLRVKEPL